MEKVLEPRIRFRGFNEPWEELPIQEFCDFGSGYGYTKSDLRPNGAPIILYGRLYTKYKTEISDVDTFAERIPNSVLSSGGEVIIPSSGETAEDIAVASVIANSGIIVGGGLHILRPKDGLLPYHLATSITYGRLHDKLSKLAQGKSVVHLYKDNVASQLISTPSVKEQESIRDLFVNLDSVYSSKNAELEKLENLKKACMERMFPREDESIPEIRFKEFTDKWEIVPLNSIGSKVIDKNAKKEFNEVFTNSAEYGVISQKEYFDHDIANKDNTSNYYIVRPNDFVYNPRISSFALYGPINRNKTGLTGVVSPLYTVFSVKNVNYLFLEYFFKTSLWHSFMRLNGDNGARHDRFSIGSDLFFKMPIYLPSPAEQEKIGKYFLLLDNLIAAKRQEIEKLQNIKQSLLDKMFV